MEEQPTDLAALLPGIAGQMRGLLSNLYLAAAQAIPAERREQDAVLDSKAAVLEQSFYRLLRMVNGISATEYLSEKSTLSLRDTDIVQLVSAVCEASGDCWGFGCALSAPWSGASAPQMPPLWNRRSISFYPTR